MITIWKTPIVATVEQVLKDLKLQLYGAGLLKEIKNTGSDLMCTCPFHANGKEHNPSCGVLLQQKVTNCRCVYIPVVSDTFEDNELNELTGSVRGAENYEKWRVEQDEQLKQQKLLQEAEEKKLELEDANFELAYLAHSGGTDGTGKYSVAVVSCVAMRYQITNDINPKVATESPMYYGVGLGRAGTHIITHDIKSTVNKSSDLNVAQALSTGGSSGAITMDIAVKDEVESPHYEGVGVGMAFTKIITHDINSKATNSGNTTVASPVNTATVITIN